MTGALLWLGDAPECLSDQATAQIESAPILYASPISLWEVAHKCRLGKLELSVSPEEWFDTIKAEYGISILPLDEAVMMRSASLPFVHRDPADRFIIATALLRNLTVVTKDRRFGEHPSLRFLFTPVLINEGVPQSQRLVKLNETAIQQMRSRRRSQVAELTDGVI